MKERPNLGSFLSFAYISGTGPGTIDLRFPHQFRFQHNEVTRRENRSIITELLRSFGGCSYEMHITLEPEGSTHRKPGFASNLGLPPTLEDDMQNEPIIKSVLDHFDGEIIT